MIYASCIFEASSWESALKWVLVDLPNLPIYCPGENKLLPPRVWEEKKCWSTDSVIRPPHPMLTCGALWFDVSMVCWSLTKLFFSFKKKFNYYFWKIMKKYYNFYLDTNLSQMFKKYFFYWIQFFLVIDIKIIKRALSVWDWTGFL